MGFCERLLWIFIFDFCKILNTFMIIFNPIFVLPVQIRNKKNPLGEVHLMGFCERLLWIFIFDFCKIFNIFMIIFNPIFVLPVQIRNKKDPLGEVHLMGFCERLLWIHFLQDQSRSLFAFSEYHSSFVLQYLFLPNHYSWIS